jgi:Uma2 family endonuclease
MIAQVETYTIEEYLALEVASESRNEYREGEIIPMTGGTPNHNDIAGNLYALLKSNLRGKPYRTFILDQRLWLPDCSLYTYPDVMVIQQPVQLQTGRTDTLMNASLVAEVLSKSTRDYDRGDKFVSYRTMPNFCEYLLIDQYRIYVEHYVKTAVNQWLMTQYDDPAIALSLNSIEAQIQIADLYENIDFQ